MVHVKSLLTVNLLGLLLSRAFVLEGAMPFGTAFFSEPRKPGHSGDGVSAAAGIISTAGWKTYRHMALWTCFSPM